MFAIKTHIVQQNHTCSSGQHNEVEIIYFQLFLTLLDLLISKSLLSCKTFQQWWYYYLKKKTKLTHKENHGKWITLQLIWIIIIYVHISFKINNKYSLGGWFFLNSMTTKRKSKESQPITRQKNNKSRPRSLILQS